MDFFGMGMGEILLIVIIALILWKPSKIVEVSRTLGRIAHNLRKSTSDFTASLTKELDIEEKERPSQSRASGGNKAGDRPNTDMSASNNTESSSPKN